MKRLLSVLLLAAAYTLAQPVPSYKDLKYPPLREVKIPQPTMVTLSNGMRVFMLEDHELPLIHGLALVRTGNLFDPPDQRGLADLTAEVLRSGGTKSKTGDQIDEELENRAASVESGMDETSASITFSALKETAGPVFDVFKDLLTNPEFRQDKLDLALSQTRSAISRRNDEASAIADRELLRILYGRDTPYGWQIEYEHLTRIHRDDLIQFYRRYYFPKNIMLGIYGDFSTAEMQDRLEKLFSGWTVEQPAAPPFPPVTAKPAPGTYLAEKADVTQTFFAVGELGGTLRDKDYPALQVAANILGQGFSSRLVTEIRTKLGYAYDINAAWSANYNHPGTFRIDGSTKSVSTTETLQAIGVELDKIRSSKVTEQELDEAKQSVLNSFVFFFDSAAKALNRVMRYEYFGYPKDFLQQYQKSIAAVTSADVLQAARERFRPENMTIVAVGNPKEFGKPLAALGKLNLIDLTIPEPKPEPKKEAAKSNPVSQERGRELLARAQQAVGGAAKVAAIKDSDQSLQMAMDPAAGGLKLKQRNLLLAPGYLRQEQELPFGKVVAYTDGKMGWLSTPQGLMPMPPTVLKQAQGEVFRSLFLLLQADRNPSLTVSAVGKNVVEISAPDGQTVKIELDESTGLPTREMYQESTSPGGGPAAIEKIFSDWREVDGLKAPFKVTIQQDGKRFAEATVQEYKFNTGLKVEELSKKP